jgi:hypothetical protein
MNYSGVRLIRWVWLAGFPLVWVGSPYGGAIAQSQVSSPSPVWSAETSPDPSTPVWVPESNNAAASPEAQSVVEPSASPASADLAQNPDAIPSPEEVERIREQLDSYEKAPSNWQNPYRSSPSITMTVPSGFGADRGRVFTGFGVSRTRINSTDGSAAIGIGLGDAQKSVGVQVSYTAFSVSPEKFLELFGVKSSGSIPASDRPFGSGGFNLKVHRQFGNGWSAAIGADSIVNIGPQTTVAIGDGRAANELEGTYYAAVTKVIPLRQDVSEPFSRLTLTAGAGTGRFLNIRQSQSGKFYINPFFSAALRVSQSINVITEWSGNDLGVGASIVPFRRLPLVITPAIRDLLGPDAINGPRFVMGVGLSF